MISPPPTSFFDFTSEKSGSTPVVSQSIMKLIVPVGARTVACAFRQPETSPSVERLVPRAAGRGEQVVRHRARVLDVADRGAVLRDDAGHRGRVRLVAGERAHPLRDLGRLAVRAAGHERGDRGRVGATFVGVVREPARHQERAEVRVAEPELAVRLRVPLDLGRRVRRVADGDLLREEDDVDRVLERLDVELAVLACGTS